MNKEFSYAALQALSFLHTKDLGRQKFRTFPFTEHFGIDAILGLDFLKKHAVLIDMPNKRAFISPIKNESESIDNQAKDRSA